MLSSFLAAVKPFHGFFPSHLCPTTFRELSLSACASAPINSPASPSPSKFKRTPHSRSQPADRGGPQPPTATTVLLDRDSGRCKLR